MSDLINPHGLDLGRTLQRRLAEAEAEITRLRGESRALRAMIRVNLLRYGPSDLTHQEIDREIEIAVNPPPLDAKTPAKG